MEPADSIAEPVAVGSSTWLRLLSGGAQAFPRMLEAIRRANRYVHLEVYELALDSVGRQFVEALLQAATRGVRVQVILDGWGSFADGKAATRLLREGGCDARIFHPLSEFLRARLQRNHRKILLVDDWVTFVGGINISEAYASSEKRAGWADLAVEIQGPAGAWLLAELRGERKEPLDQPGLRLWLAHEGGARKLRKRYLKAIGSARTSLYLAHAYFLPDRRLIRSLRAASRRGVQITLLLAGQSDVFFARAATMRLHQQLLRAGVRIFEWTRSVLHAKAAVVDGHRLLVGSFNLDPLSLANLEILLEVDNEELALQGESWIRSRIDRSDEVQLGAHHRSFLQRWFWDVLGLWAARATLGLAAVLTFRRRWRDLKSQPVAPPTGGVTGGRGAAGGAAPSAPPPEPDSRRA